MKHSVIRGLLLLTLSFYLPSVCGAQRLMLGIKAGLNAYSVHGVNINEGYNAAFVGGAYLGLKYQKFSISAEGLFNQSEITPGNGFGDAYHTFLNQSNQQLLKGHFKFSNLSIPVLLGIKLFPAVWIQIGPQFTQSVTIEDKDHILNNVKDVFKSGYVSGVGGINVDLPFHLHAGARYIMDISNRNNTSVDDPWRSKVIQAYVSFGL